MELDNVFMSRAVVITEDVFTEFAVLVAGGMQRKKAAQQVGHSVKSLRNACKRLGLPWPARTLLTEQIKEFEPQILAGTISQHQIAEELDCSQAHISLLYKKLGYPARPIGDSGPSAATKAERIRNCERVLERLESAGGYLKPAVLALGLPESFRHHVVEYAKTIDFDFEDYRFAHRQYGHWVTLVGKAKPIHKCDYLVKARCTKCGSVHDVNLVNMKMGASTQCIDCSRAERKGRAGGKKIKCDETGELLSSIRKLSLRTGVPHSSISYRLTNGGFFQHEGMTYRLV